ncbi:MAG: methyltransferase domain-containing protein [Saprospiraceae bacterium]
MHFLDQDFPLEHPDTPLLFDQLSLWSSYFGKMLLENVPMQQGIKVLDVGPATGFPLIELAQILGNSCELVGIDPWEEALKRAQWKIEKQGLTNVKIVQGDASKTPFTDAYFDLIVSNVGINNFVDPPVVLSECYRVLKRMGKICITTNLEGHFREFYAVFESTLKELGLSELLPVLKKQEEHRGTDESVRDLFENANFSITKMIRGRFQMRFLDGSALLNHLLVVMGFLPDWKNMIPQNRQREVFGLLEKKLNEQAKWDGELRMTVPMLYVEAIK